MEPIEDLANELRMGGEYELVCGDASVLADELQVRREVVVPTGGVDVALAQKSLRGVLPPEENKLCHDSGKLYLQTFSDS